MPLATFTLGGALLEALELALLFIWIWIAIGVVLDIFRSRDLSGWGKALWLLLIIILPFLGVLIYLIVRGHNMHERTAQAAQTQDRLFGTTFARRRPAPQTTWQSSPTSRTGACSPKRSSSTRRPGRLEPPCRAAAPPPS
jgi:hypothetical protein